MEAEEAVEMQAGLQSSKDGKLGRSCDCTNYMHIHYKYVMIDCP